MTDPAVEQQQQQQEPDAATQEHAALEQRVAALEAQSSGTSSSSSSTSNPGAAAGGAALSFERVPTGRTHTVGGVVEPIVDADGNPETEWTLYATVDGTKVPLLTKPGSLVANWKIREQRLAERDAARG